MSQVSQLYDTLFSFESSKRSSSYPVHKRLLLDVADADLLDWLLGKVKFSYKDHVLDAGCGTGYCLLKLAKEEGVSGKGISLAKKEVAFAYEQAKQLDLGQQVEFEVASFEDPFPGKFDKILAIESTKHVANIESVLSKLADGLQEDGVLIIADDFVLDEGSKLLNKHKKFWKVPGFDFREKTVNELKRKGLEVNQFDLTQSVPRRSKFLLNMLIFLVSLALRVARKKHRMKVEVYLGGLMLEHLYNHGKVGYYAIIARKS